MPRLDAGFGATTCRDTANSYHFSFRDCEYGREDKAPVQQVRDLLETLAALGHARQAGDDRYAA